MHLYDGPLQFKDTETETFPGLTPEITASRVSLADGGYAISLAPTAAAKAGTIPIDLHNVPDSRYPSISEDYTIHVSLIGSDATVQSLTVTPSAADIVVGQTLPLHAEARYSDGTTADLTGTVTWSSDAPQVATVGAGSSAGVARGVARGIAHTGSKEKFMHMGGGILGTFL